MKTCQVPTCINKAAWISSITKLEYCDSCKRKVVEAMKAFTVNLKVPVKAKFEKLNQKARGE